MTQGTAIIIGAGPAGLTAALELQRHTQIKPIVIEAGDDVGGLVRTVRYKGNRMDIGGHRFFSKSDRVMQWWLDLMPLEAGASTDGHLGYQAQRRDIPIPDAIPERDSEDLVMLVRRRKSRIYFLRRFFDYPVRLTADTFRKMGWLRALRVGCSYLYSSLLPCLEERSLEDFFINRFGRQLYLTFFKSYTEKVWGVPCSEISAEWGAQRIKGLSLKEVVKHFLVRSVGAGKRDGIAQQKTQTSLIDRFLYPKLGCGQLWERAAYLVCNAGGEIHLSVQIDRVNVAEGRVISIEGVNWRGERVCYAGDYFFSTMPVRDLIRSLSVPVPPNVTEVTEGLTYRDFITVGLLANKLKVTEQDGSRLQDNWIYIQESDVLLGRLQIFNNWSPWLAADNEKVWIGLEYFCNQSDPLWNLTDEEMTRFAVSEVVKIGMLDAEEVEDSHVVRVPKTYPAYLGSYDKFEIIRRYVDEFENLFLIGRNGMHKYNNQDHAMLTAMTAVENIVNGVSCKDNLWAINAEMEYHEQKSN